MNEIVIPVQLDEDAVMPTKAHFRDAGFDLHALEDVDILAGDIVKINTGVRVSIPQGYYGQIMDKSGLGSKGLKVFGGVVDSGYTGNIFVCLGNMETRSVVDYMGKILTNLISKLVGAGELFADVYDNHPEGRYSIKKGDKIAQLVLHETPLHATLEEAESLEDTQRGDKGFGSTGV